MQKDLTDELVKIVMTAHREILDVYQSNFEVALKGDQSPITEADRRSQDVIESGLHHLDSAIPIVSEESEIPSYSERRAWNRYWLVDPLDGTKEFVKRNGEFTVNIALIEDGSPIFGIVGRPTANTVYWGDVIGAEAQRLNPRDTTVLKTRSLGLGGVVSIQSRRKPDAIAEQFLENLEAEVGTLTRMNRGSSLKFLSIAESEVDLYLQPGGTSEWDTAAAQAVLEAAGGQVMTLDGQRLCYNKGETLANLPFLAIGDPSLEWHRRFKEMLRIFST